ncbi:MAG TPA: ABC transporter permease [Acidobacteriota bacterium]|nr:ABC transporter permease [Acidobacteriota bacterium]
MPDWKPFIEPHLDGLSGPRRAEISAELSDHLEDVYRESRQRGLTVKAARREALAHLDDSNLGMRLHKIERPLSGLKRLPASPGKLDGGSDMSRFLQGWTQDFRYGLRLISRRRTFALLTIVTLALGIGGTATVFSVFYGILLRPLPYPQAERLVWIHNEYEGNPSANSVPDYFDRVESSGTLESLAAYWTRDVNLTGEGEPVRVKAARVTASYFEVLGMNPLLGTFFDESHDQPGQDDVAVLSYGFWQRRFGGQTEALGRTLHLDGRPYTVLGVMPQGFDLPSSQVDLYRPAAFTLAHRQDSQRGNEFLRVLGRLRPDVSFEEAEAEMDAIAANVIATVPSRADFLRRVDWSAQLVPFRERYTANVRAPLWMLLAAVGCLLLIACVNVANLQLAQSSLRMREVAVRASFGAPPLRLLRQLLGESLLLCLVGGAAGVLLAAALLRLLLTSAPEGFPLIDNSGLNTPTLLAALALSLAAGLATGILPAWKILGRELSPALHQSGRGGAVGGLGLRRLLVVGEVALAVVLLTGAGLLLRSFLHLVEVDPGFSVEQRMSAEISLPAAQYAQPAQRHALFQQVLDDLGGRPGITSAGFIDWLPLDPIQGTATFYIEDQPPTPGSKQPGAEVKTVSPGFFRTLDVRLLQGRLFTRQDDSSSLPTIIVNRQVAQRYWPDEDAVGKRVGPSEEGPWREIVGVVEGLQSRSVGQEPADQVFVPLAQTGGPRSMVLVAEGGLSPQFMAQEIRSAVKAADPQLPVFNLRPLERAVESNLAPKRYPMLLLAAFAALGLLLAAVGIYGVISAFVTQRTREIGVRMALGGRPSNIRALILRQGLALAALGLVAGMATSLILSRFLASLLFGVSPADPLTLVAVALIVFLLALLPCYTPARRATRIDPVQALGAE